MNALPILIDILPSMELDSRSRIYLVRHCDVHNPEGIIYGFRPGTHLSTYGVAQARILGSYFRNRPISALVTSPLERAMETASIIANTHTPPLSMTVSDDLREADFNRYLEGIRRPLIPLLRPLWLIHLAAPGLLPHDESVDTQASRMNRAVHGALHANPGGESILVSHGDPIQSFWIAASGRSKYAIHHLQCAKGGMLILDFEHDALTNLEYLSPLEIRFRAAHPDARDESRLH